MKTWPESRPITPQIKLLGEEELDLFRLVNDISENEHVLYAFITNKENIIKAHSNLEEVNKTYIPPKISSFFRNEKDLKIGRLFRMVRIFSCFKDRSPTRG